MDKRTQGGGPPRWFSIFLTLMYGVGVLAILLFGISKALLAPGAPEIATRIIITLAIAGVATAAAVIGHRYIKRKWTGPTTQNQN